MKSSILGIHPTLSNWTRSYIGRLSSKSSLERGQDLAEYGLLLFLIAIIVIAAIGFVGEQIEGLWQYILANFY